MISSQVCLDEARLLAIAMGDRPSAAEDGHLVDCVSCRQRGDRIRVEVSHLRRSRGGSRRPLDRVDAVD